MRLRAQGSGQKVARRRLRLRLRLRLKYQYRHSRNILVPISLFIIVLQKLAFFRSKVLFVITPILTTFDTIKINRVWIYQEKATKPF
jgi:hypothetical protein